MNQSSRREALVGLSASLAYFVPSPCLAQGVTNDEIRIGQSCQLTGPLASISTEIRAGAALHLNQINRDGGLNGRQIRVITLDDGYSPDRAAENTRRLVAEHDVLALFQYAGTPPVLASAPIAEELKVPFLAPYTGADALRRPSRYIFNMRASYGDELERIAKQLSVIGIKRVAAAYLNNSFGTGGLASFKQAVTKHNLSLVAEAPLDLEGTELQQSIAKIAKAAPQAVIVISAGKPSVDFVDAYSRAGHRTSFYMMSVIGGGMLSKALGPRSRGVVVSQVVPSPWKQSSAAAREIRNLAQESGLRDYTHAHMEGFLAAKVLVEGLRRTRNSPTREGLVHALETMKYVEFGGFAVEFSEKNHHSRRFVDLMIMGPDGRFE